ncbi:MAG: hypothetical protein QF464_23875, partial [Myxococcota bacterium]|nr:hypothetical protein [Myxococcota bacterium]
DNPKLVEALGGTITHETPEPTEGKGEGEGEEPELEGDEGDEGDESEGDEGKDDEKTYKSNIKISLPLAFLPVPKSYAKKLGCSK